MIDLKSILLLLKGAFITLEIFLGTIFISLFLGTFLGIISCKEFNVPLIPKIIDFTTFIIRAIPSYVLVLFVFFGLPQITGIKLPIVIAAIIALGINASGFVSQIVQTGINSLDKGQWEASFVYGFNKPKSLKLIIIPQLLKNTLPIFISEYTHMIKSTSAISTLGVFEITKFGMKLVSEGKSPLIVYSFVGLIYILISVLIIIVGKHLKKKINYDLW